MTTTRPTKCVVPGQIGQIIGYKDYYFESERVLCTRAFLVTAVSTTIDDGEFPPRSTELNEETGHNCKMTKIQYRDFTQLVLGLDNETWANHCTESALRNMILQDLDALLYYFDMDWQENGTPILPPGDLTDIAIILARLTLLLIGANACTPYIISKVWGEDDAARLALGGPRGDLSLIRR